MKQKFYLFNLGAFVLGIILGFIVPSIFPSIAFLGTIYINLLKMMIVPILFFGISSALASSKRAGAITLKTILLFIIMFSVSYLICYGLFSVIQPGVGFNFIPVEWNGTTVSTSFEEFFVAIFPNNIIQAMANNSILPVILFAFIFGIALRHITQTVSERLITTLNCFNLAFNKMLEYVLYFTPIGIFALMGNTVATYGSQILTTCAIYVGCAWLGCLIIALIVMILPVWIYCHINPIEYIKRISKIWLITLSTCGSAATLPYTIKVCNEEFGIDKEITDIVVPLGCTIHMCGGAVSFSLLALFNCQMYGITITPIMFITMLVAAILINMGAPGIPGGGVVIGASYLALIGCPLDFIGVYAGFYRLLDMAYTTMNVSGDITANLLINKNINKGIV